MPCAESIVLAFFALREAADAALLAYVCKGFASACQQFMGISTGDLHPRQVYHQEYQHIVQGDSEFDHAQTCPQMTAVRCDNLYDAGAQLLGQRWQLFYRYVF